MKGFIRKLTSMHQRPTYALLFLLLLSAGPTAYATCRVDTKNPQDIIMNVGKVLITPTSNVGDILATGKFYIQHENNVFCSNPAMLYGRIQQGGPSSIDKNIWTTNVPGIGIRLYRQFGIHEGAERVFYPHSRPFSAAAIVSEGYFVVDVIKIANNTGTGSLAPGQYSSSYSDGSDFAKPILISHIVANSITVVPSSCSIDAGSKNKVINLSSVATTEFKGVGSTAAEQHFSININCVGGQEQKQHCCQAARI
uniref:fimbrial protein n=1 Tax=Yersinia frederiksenii TaxID=29484 RepID=UPI001F4C1D95|nr:fimbrial protein [Yersinia frederiksenii]ULG19943.1 hypothetical protein 49p1_00243 [Yersinia frederiksenii]